MEERTMEKLPGAIYYVESPEDNTVLIGLDVRIEREAGQIAVSWYDTNKYRRMMAAETAIDGERFAFRRAKEEGGGRYYFAPMTLAIYEAKVRAAMVGQPEYKNEEELTRGILAAAKDTL